MNSFIQTAGAAVIVATISAAASAAVGVDAADALIRTATGEPTIQSLVSYAETQQACRIVRRSETEVEFSGACFGFPKEQGSHFLADGHGDVTFSEIVLSDHSYGSDLKQGLQLIAGKARPIADFGLGWVISGERWKLEDKGEYVVFVREKLTDESKELRRLKERMDVLDRF